MSVEVSQISPEELERVDMRTGAIVAVEDFPRARKPSYRVVIDFGEELGRKASSVQATNYEKSELLGLRVVCVVNLLPKNIAGFLSEVLVLGVPGEDGKLSLLTPTRKAALGGRVF
jgi:tRNA-binding protein